MGTERFISSLSIFPSTTFGLHSSFSSSGTLVRDMLAETHPINSKEIIDTIDKSSFILGPLALLI